MAVINRIQVTNYLKNMRGSGDWSPRFVDMVYNFLGLCTIIQMANGVGKTALSNAFNGLLSRKRKLLERARESMVPSKGDSYSHFRIEFGTPIDDATLLGITGDVVLKDKHVFGMYGTSATGSLNFYHYPGTLEELPVCEHDDDGTVRVFSQKRFDDLLSSFGGSLQKGLARGKWLQHVGEKVPLHVVERMARFQEEGGGEGQTSGLFQVKAVKGERYDQTFFWEVLAPELMANAMGAFAEDDADEYFFEKTILQTVSQIVDAQIAADKEVAVLEKQTEAQESLENLVEVGQSVLDSQNRFNVLGRKLEHAMASVRYAVEDSGIPGFLNYTPSGDEKVDILLPQIVIDPDQGPLLRDRGLASLLGKEPKHVNRDAMERSIPCASSTQPIEIILDHGFPGGGRPQGGGKANRYYTYEAASSFLDKAKDSYLPSAREDLQEVLERIFGHFSSTIDTNPFRQRTRRLTKDRVQVLQSLNGLREEEARLKKEIIQAERGQEEFKENKASYTEVCESGLFTKGELEDPLHAKKSLEDSLAAKIEAISNHNTRVQGYADDNAIYTRFIEEFGEEASPSQKKETWMALENELKKEKITLAEQHDNTTGAEKAARDLKAEKEKELTGKKGKLTAMNALAEKAMPFLEAFPEQDPKGFAGKIRERKGTLAEEIAKTVTTVKGLKSQAEHIESWKLRHPERGPKEFISWFGQERELLLACERETSDTIAGLEEDIRFLENHQVAPGKAAREALEVAQDIVDVVPVHEFIVHLGLSGERLDKVLSLFSALLFAPVVEDATVARLVLDSFGEQHRRYSVPVFLADDLESFARAGDIGMSDEGELVHAVFAGCRSFTVECILDPEKLARELYKAKTALEEIQGQLDEVSEHILSMGDDNKVLKHARDALRAQEENVPARLKASNEELTELKGQKRKLDNKFPEEMLNAAAKAEELADAGGQQAIGMLQGEIDTIKQVLEATQKKLDDAEAKLIDIRTRQGDRDKRWDEYINESAPFMQSMEGLILFVQKRGPQFMATSRKVLEELNTEEDGLQKKLRLPLGRAASYLLTLSEKDTKKVVDLGDLKSNRQAILKDIVEAEQRERALETRISELQKNANSYDHHASSILPSYRSLAVLLHDEDLSLGEAEAKVDDHLREQAETLLHALDDVETESQAILSAMGEIKHYVVEEIDLKQNASKARYERNVLQGYKADYTKRTNAFLAADRPGFSLEEREALRTISESPEKVRAFAQRRGSRLESQKEECNRAREHEQRLLEQGTKDLARLARQSVQNLYTLRNVLRERRSDGSSRGGATFEVKVKPEEDLTPILEKLMHEVRRMQLLLSKEHDKKIMDDDREAAKIRKSTLETIRFRLYRQIFPKPVVKVDFPLLRQEKELYSEKFSSGERMALSLLWLSILAEYSMMVENINTSSGKMSGKRRDMGPSIFWIDGLFSHLSDSDILKATVSLQHTRGRFQLIGLMHNPASLIQHDFKSFPRLYVTMLQSERSTATGRELAVSEGFRDGEADKVLMFLEQGRPSAAESHGGLVQ